MKGMLRKLFDALCVGAVASVGYTYISDVLNWCGLNANVFAIGYVSYMIMIALFKSNEA